jgi:putative resolvase
MAYVREKGYGEIEVLTDIVSGLNEKRKNFLKLLEMFSEKKVYKVIVSYEDRLTRFGFETLSRLFSLFGTTIEVINRKEKTHKYNEVVEGVKKLVSG